MKKRKTLKYIIGGCVIVIAVFLVGMLGYPDEGSDVVKKGSSVRSESEEWLFENSDIISYVEVLQVDTKIKGPTKPFPPGINPIFSMQRAKVKFLKILKGPESLEGTIGNVIKDRSYFYLTEKEKSAPYLKEKNGLYHTVGSFSGQRRLASALADINNLRGDIGSGIVVGILNKGDLSDSKLHILQGRHKAPVILGSKVWKNNLIKVERVSKFDIAGIPLERGAYTILLELKGNLYAFSRLVDGYYPYVILEENNWRALYFDIKKTKQSI